MLYEMLGLKRAGAQPGPSSGTRGIQEGWLGYLSKATPSNAHAMLHGVSMLSQGGGRAYTRRGVLPRSPKGGRKGVQRRLQVRGARPGRRSVRSGTNF